MECKWGEWCVCFPPELSPSPQKWRISMFYGLSPGSLCLLLDVQFGPGLEGACSPSWCARPVVWRWGTVSPESANFPFFLSSVPPSGDWKSHFSSLVATVTIFCDFSYCYPVPCPREARMLHALWRLLSGSYFLSFCENVASLESCPRCVGSVLHVFFSLNFLSFSISHFCLGCPWLDLSSMLGLPAAVGCWVASHWHGGDDSQCPVWKMRFRWTVLGLWRHLLDSQVLLQTAENHCISRA